LRQDVGLADRTLAQLSALLRRVVDAADVQEVPLADELALAGEYLAIQATRFQTELRVETRVEPGLEQALVPILVLQPLIENACLHGIGRHPSGGRVIIEVERAGRYLLRLRVSNDGPDLGPLATEGVGLSNSRKRLEALYGEHGALVVRPRTGGGAETTVELPLHWPDDATRATAEPVSLEAGRG
jgi:two-component system LytT family sensor kinase